MIFILAVLILGSICSFVHLCGFLIAARLWKVKVEMIGFTIGITTLELTFQGERRFPRMKLKPGPGGYVKFHGDQPEEEHRPGSFSALHPLSRFLIFLSGPLAIFALACVLLGLNRGCTSFWNGVLQCFDAAIHPPTRGRDLLAAFGGLIDAGQLRIALGVLAAKMAAFNSLPNPVSNVGQALFTIIQWRRPVLKGIFAFQVFGMVLILVMFVLYVWALFAYFLT